MGEACARRRRALALERARRVGPLRPGQGGHSAEHALGRAADEPDAAIAFDPVGDAVADRAHRLRFGCGEALGLAGCEGDAVRLQGAGAAIRGSRPADRRAQVHHRLGEIAGAICRESCASSSSRMARLALGDRRLDPVQAGDHALDIGVDHQRSAAEGDRRDGRRRIGADAGKRSQLGLGGRESRRALATSRAQAMRFRARA